MSASKKKKDDALYFSSEGLEIPAEQAQFRHFDEDGNEYWDVEKIITKEYFPDERVWKYKVHWKGFTEADCTWEPVDNLQTVLDIVEAFEEDLKAKRKAKREKKKEEQALYKLTKEEKKEEKLETLKDMIVEEVTTPKEKPSKKKKEEKAESVKDFVVEEVSTPKEKPGRKKKEEKAETIKDFVVEEVTTPKEKPSKKKGKLTKTSKIKKNATETPEKKPSPKKDSFLDDELPLGEEFSFAIKKKAPVVIDDEQDIEPPIKKKVSTDLTKDVTVYHQEKGSHEKQGLRDSSAKENASPNESLFGIKMLTGGLLDPKPSEHKKGFTENPNFLEKEGNRFGDLEKKTSLPSLSFLNDKKETPISDDKKTPQGSELSKPASIFKEASSTPNFEEEKPFNRKSSLERLEKQSGKSSSLDNKSAPLSLFGQLLGKSSPPSSFPTVQNNCPIISSPLFAETSPFIEKLKTVTQEAEMLLEQPSPENEKEGEKIQKDPNLHSMFEDLDHMEEEIKDDFDFGDNDGADFDDFAPKITKRSRSKTEAKKGQPGKEPDQIKPDVVIDDDDDMPVIFPPVKDRSESNTLKRRDSHVKDRKSRSRSRSRSFSPRFSKKKDRWSSDIKDDKGKYKSSHSHKDKEKHWGKSRDKSKEREREKEKEKERGKDKGKDREREREREKEKEKERGKEKYKEHKDYKDNHKHRDKHDKTGKEDISPKNLTIRKLSDSKSTNDSTKAKEDKGEVKTPKTPKTPITPVMEVEKGEIVAPPVKKRQIVKKVLKAKNNLHNVNYTQEKGYFEDISKLFLAKEIDRATYLDLLSPEGNFKDDIVENVMCMSWEGKPQNNLEEYYFKVVWKPRENGVQKACRYVSWLELLDNQPRLAAEFMGKRLTGIISKFGTFGEC